MKIRNDGNIRLKRSLYSFTMDNCERPLLSTIGDQEEGICTAIERRGKYYDDDIDPIVGIGDFLNKFSLESKKLWSLAGPTILLYLCQYSLAATTQIFLGQVGVLELAAFAYEHLVIAGISSGILVNVMPISIYS